MPALGGWITVCVNGKDRAVEPDKEPPAERSAWAAVPRSEIGGGANQGAEPGAMVRPARTPLECDGLAAGSCRGTGLPASPASSTSGKHAKKGSFAHPLEAGVETRQFRAINKPGNSSRKSKHRKLVDPEVSGW
jgi:hypothetical protein